MSAVMLMIAMALTIKVLGWVAAERRAWDRRQWAAQEAAEPDGAGDGPALDDVSDDVAPRDLASLPRRGGCSRTPS